MVRVSSARVSSLGASNTAGELVSVKYWQAASKLAAANSKALTGVVSKYCRPCLAAGK